MTEHDFTAMREQRRRERAQFDPDEYDAMLDIEHHHREQDLLAIIRDLRKQARHAQAQVAVLGVLLALALLRMWWTR